MANYEERKKLMGMLFSKSTTSQTLAMSMLTERKYTIAGIYNTAKTYIQEKAEEALNTKALLVNKTVTYVSESLVAMDHPNYKYLSFELCGKRFLQYPNTDVVEIISTSESSGVLGQLLIPLYQTRKPYQKENKSLKMNEKAIEIAKMFVKQTFNNQEREILRFLNTFLL